MKKRNLLVLLISCLGIFQLGAQSFAFGIKGGPILGIQQWNSADRDPLFSYHGIAFIESYSETDDLVSVFLQAGYHIRGSAVRNQQFSNNNQLFKAPTIEYVFRNVGLSLGAKKKYNISGNSKAYYMLGVRGEYNLGTNFSGFESLASAFYPNDFFVRPFVFGAIFGGGIEFPFGELIGGTVELTLNPDITRQYIQPPIGNVTSPWDPSQTINVGERNIRNITIELSIGLRFLRIVEYLD
ncbi:MAG: hypothetical protein KDC34_00665 [Saprospiraceae bacterium]|nr:hypothetical protein [Saprospiraceae bacterium]